MEDITVDDVVQAVKKLAERPREPLAVQTLVIE